nr:CACTA transposable element [Tanacetum cinerariifolium]
MITENHREEEDQEENNLPEIETLPLFPIHGGSQLDFFGGKASDLSLDHSVGGYYTARMLPRPRGRPSRKRTKGRERAESTAKVMVIDKSWTSLGRHEKAFYTGLKKFIEDCKSLVDSVENIKCPCKSCRLVLWVSIENLSRHITNYGFDPSYKTWIHHGEPDLPPLPPVIDNARQPHRSDMTAYLNDLSHILLNNEQNEPTQGDIGETSNESTQAKRNEFEEFKSVPTRSCTLPTQGDIGEKSNEPTQDKHNEFEELYASANEKLYPGYDYTLKTIGLGYESTHACVNDCFLFRGDANKDVHFCPVCKTSRWKDSNTPRKKVPKKVLHFFLIIPRLQRLYKSSHTAKEMTWHATGECTEPGKMQHPIDGKAWKNFDTKYPDFAEEPRNVRLGLDVDGFNPFGNLSQYYNMWPVVLTTYNLPLWLCMKESSFMLTLSIPGPKSLGKDIDVYLRPLINDLKDLWAKPGVETIDVVTGQKFNMRAMVLWIINDFPARSKTAYVGPIRFLKKTCKWRRSLEFNGEKEDEDPPREFGWDQIQAQLARLPTRVKEAIDGGPIHPQWMYPFERFMKKLKNYDVTMKFNRPEHNVDFPPPTCQFQVKDNKEKDKIKIKPDKIKSKREAWKSPDSCPTKSNPSQSQESIKPRWENDLEKLGTAPDSLRGRNCRRSKQRVENFNLEEYSHPVVTMADQRTIAQLLQAPTEGYKDAVVVPAITVDNFELKHGLLTLVQNKQFFGRDKEDPHAHICYFNNITSTLKFPNIPNTSIKLMLFPFSLEGAARIWLEKEPPQSILTWDDLVSKFINQFFPPSKTTSLRNEITNFQQRLDESFSESWDRFKDLLRAYPHHGFSELHQLDTFYNALNSKDQDSLNSAAGGNFLDKMPRDCLSIIESKSKVRYSRDKPVVAKVSTNASTSGVSPDVAELKDMVKALLLDKKRSKSISGSRPVYQPSVFQQPAYQAPAYQAPAPQTQGVSKEDFLAYVKPNDAVMKNMQTQGQNMQNQLTNLIDLITKFVNSNSASTSSSGTLPSNTIANPKSDLKAITTRSGVSYDGPQIPPPVVENKLEVTKDTVNPTNKENTKDVQPQTVQSKFPVSISEPAIASVRASKPNPKASIPYPSRRNDEMNYEKANNQIKKFYQIFKDMSFEISFADALILMPKFASTLKALIGNKEKLSEMA